MAQPCQPRRSLPLNRAVKPLGMVPGASSAAVLAGARRKAVTTATRETVRVRMAGYSGGSRPGRGKWSGGPGAAAGCPAHSLLAHHGSGSGSRSRSFRKDRDKNGRRFRPALPADRFGQVDQAGELEPEEQPILRPDAASHLAPEFGRSAGVRLHAGGPPFEVL